MEHNSAEHPSLGLCLIAKNEEKRIAQCIESVREIVDEIVVVDTGSEDDTVRIAEGLGAVVYHYPWDGNFSHARNFAIAHAQSTWLLLLDADEQVDRDSLNSIVTFIRTTALDGAYFRVRNYIGSYSPEDYTLHNALRLLRNNGKYRYEGSIHEQVVCDDLQDFPNRFLPLGVILNHYGYLDEAIAEKGKRQHNMPLLEQELREHPDNIFAQYYMGNEYLALNRLDRALEYYREAYRNAKRRHMLFAHLYLRMITCMEASGLFRQSLDFAQEALDVYPLCTDFEFVRAAIFFRTRRYTLAVKSLNRCLAMGVPPAPLEFMGGCGTYRAAYMLGDVYAEQEDYEAALEWYRTSLGYKPDYFTALYRVGFCLSKLSPDKDRVCDELFSCFSDPTDVANVVTGADILIKEGLYPQALSRLEAVTDAGPYLPETLYFKALALFYETDFAAAIPLFESAYQASDSPKDGKPALRPDIAQHLFVAGMLQKDFALLDRSLELIRQICPPHAQAAFRLLSAVYMEQPPEDPPYENEGEQEFDTIRSVYEILLKLSQPELLQKLFGALTYAGGKSALTQLARLYWDSGNREQAAKLVFLSVQDLDYLDAFGAGVLFRQIIP